jgi:GDPmannose 4,6-dehydratase
MLVKLLHQSHAIFPDDPSRFSLAPGPRSAPSITAIPFGESHTVREFVEAAFAQANLDWKQYVKHDPRYVRPAEVDILVGDSSKARKTLGWEPKVRFHEVVRIMVDADMALLSRETPREHLGRLP